MDAGRTRHEVTALLDRALTRRAPLIGALAGDTDCYRLVHGSGDGLDRLTVDRLGPAIVVEQHTADADPAPLVDALAARFPDAPIFLKQRWSPERGARAGGQQRGPALDPAVTVREHGLRYRVRLDHEEHVGLFLDGRPARRRVRALAPGRRVLNLFAYTAAFGVAAAAGGARATTNVDNKRSALARARENYALNGLPGDTRTFLRDDAIRFLNRAARGRGRFDLLILDPPPRFTRADGNPIDLAAGLGRLIARAAPLLDPGGLLLVGANSLDEGDAQLDALVSDAGALAGAPLTVVERIGPGEDFPPAARRPVARFALLAT